MNPFMTPGAFTHTYASQYAAAIAAASAAAAQQQQRHQLGATKVPIVPSPALSAPKTPAPFPSHAPEPAASAPEQLAAAYYMTPAAMAAAAASFAPFSAAAAATTNGYLTALYAGAPSPACRPVGQCDKRPARAQAPPAEQGARDHFEGPADEDAKKRLKIVKANGFGRDEDELDSRLLRHDCCAHGSHSKSPPTTTSSTTSSARSHPDRDRAESEVAPETELAIEEPEEQGEQENHEEEEPQPQQQREQEHQAEQTAEVEDKVGRQTTDTNNNKAREHNSTCDHDNRQLAQTGKGKCRCILAPGLPLSLYKLVDKRTRRHTMAN